MIKKAQNIRPERRPLADRMRPETIDEFVGQDHLIGKEKVLRHAIEDGHIPSMILWGPPGRGKTTLAHIIAKTTDTKFIQLSATSSGVKEVRDVIADAQNSF